MSEESFTGDTSFQMPRAEMSGCALVQDLIPLYIDGEVSPASHALIADHLERCEHCSGFLAGARSVRTQIVDEETRVRAAFSANPTVAAVQQPVWSSPLASLWRFLMLLVWLGALALTALGVAEPAPPAIVLGAFGTLAAIGGLLIAGGEQRMEWRLGMLLTGMLGTFCTVGSLLVFRGGFDGVVLLGGLMQIVIAVWGLWPRGPRAKPMVFAEHAKTATVGDHPSSAQPLLTALLSLAGIALSAGLILGGIGMLSSSQATVTAPVMAGAVTANAEHMIVTADSLPGKAMLHAMPALPKAVTVPAMPAAPVFVEPIATAYGGPRWEALLFGALVTAAGIAGVLLIASRRGWLPRELRNLSARQWIGYAMAGGGLVWLSMALRTLLLGLLPSLPAVGISAALVLLGWALARRPPPDEPRVV